MGQTVGALLQLLGIFEFGPVSDGEIFRQILQLAAGKRLAEILAGDVRKLVGFVEDHHVRLRDQLAETAVLDDHIREEQMVVHHHHIRIHRRFARLHHKAVFIQRTVAAEAVVVGAGHQRPGRRVFRHARAGADIALFGLVRPGAKDNDVAEGLYRQVAARQRLLLKTFQAEIVGASLQQGQTTFVFQRFRHRGQIATVELILQRLRSGGNNHLLLRAQRRSKVSIRFTRTGSGLDHQRLSLIDGACNGVRHLALRLTGLEAGNSLR